MLFLRGDIDSAPAFAYPILLVVVRVNFCGVWKLCESAGND